MSIGSHIRSINDDVFNDFDAFQGHGIFDVLYLRNGALYGQSYYRTLVGNHTPSIEWYHFQ